ncbi:hypothetical protein ACIPW5_00390 [Streptomyces sp. NPDC090077]|uniref:hypothetical protein n=1 Tax=Streptomyces sp. NPDC090077 TaxID=3365938 RepID=UPI0038014D93
MDTSIRAALAVTALAALALPGQAAATTIAIAGPTPYANYVGEVSDTASDGNVEHLDPQQQYGAAVDGRSGHFAPQGHLDPGQI